MVFLTLVISFMFCVFVIAALSRMLMEFIRYINSEALAPATKGLAVVLLALFMLAICALVIMGYNQRRDAARDKQRSEPKSAQIYHPFWMVTEDGVKVGEPIVDGKNIAHKDVRTPCRMV